MKSYIFRLAENHYAKTLSNLHIVINSFWHIRNLALKSGVLFICFANEFAHYIQMRKLNSHKDVLDFSTPNHSKKKAKAKVSIEAKLFGKSIDYLTIKGAEYLLNGNFPAIKSFRNKIKPKNRRVKGEEIVRMSMKNSSLKDYAEFISSLKLDVNRANSKIIIRYIKRIIIKINYIVYPFPSNVKIYK